MRSVVVMTLLALGCRTPDGGKETGEWTYCGYADDDGDGFGGGEQVCVGHEDDRVDELVADGGDCDDEDDSVHPDATEVCDEVDNDCDDAVDDEDTGLDTSTGEAFYADADDDGFGDADVASQACVAPSGMVDDATDCDDADADVHPDAIETCNDIDDDCDGLIDDEDGVEDGSTRTFYADDDGDGFGDPEAVLEACEAPDATVGNDEDCDDEDSGVHPDATEICDGIDNDCDRFIDDEDTGLDTTTGEVFHADADGDGFGDEDATIWACQAPSGYVDDATDCDDADADVHPDGTESCDGIDNDCDDRVDDDDDVEDTGSMSSYYADDDGDGFGDADVSFGACEAPTGYVDDAEDCDDADADVHPDATEVCNDIDDDCDELVDDDDDSLDTGTWSTFYADDDEDGFGDADATTRACDAPSGYTSDDSDCDDENGAVHPGAPEGCTGIDDDCDGLTDDDDTIVDTGTLETFYADADNDGYGDPDSSTRACEQPSGFVTNDEDCGDGDTGMNPDAAERCNAEDDDCDTSVDEGVPLGSGEDCPGVSCLEIYDDDPTSADGAYWVQPGSSSIEVLCDMSGGGWTMVENFVYDGTTSGVSGWSSSSAVGSDFADDSQTFKLTDSDINTLGTELFRGRGQASSCYEGSCSVDITLYWDASACSFSATSRSADCDAAYTDTGLTSASSCASTACAWHHGLNATDCGTCSEYVSNHTGGHVAVGEYGGAYHAYDGRSGEDPELQVWAR